MKTSMQPVATPTSLSFPVVAIHCLGFALPRRLLPKNPSYESVDASGAVIFDIGAEIPVLGKLISYRGVLPDLFREGQGVVAEGKFTGPDTFEARTILARHDENYMPPEAKDALDKAEKNKGSTTP